MDYYNKIIATLSCRKPGQTDKITTYRRMIKPGDAVLSAWSRRGCKNSQAKGPVLDETPESECAPKRQSVLGQRNFQVRYGGTELDMDARTVSLFVFMSDYEKRSELLWN